MENKESNFQKYYNKWRDETIFLSTKNFDNDNFKALCDPNIVSPEEIIVEGYNILKEKDDFVVYAIIENLSNYCGERIVTFTGYVSISDTCELMRLFLLAIITGDDTDIKQKLQNKQ